MPTRPKDKGTWAERVVMEYLREQLFPHAERRVLAGVNDTGDLNCHPKLMFEVKNQGRLLLGPWMNEVIRQTARAKATHGFLVYKVPGLGAKSVHRWRVCMFVTDVMYLEEEAGMKATFEPARGRGFTGIKEALFEAGDAPHFAVAHAPGNTDPRFEYAICTLEDLVVLLRAAGYGSSEIKVKDSLT